MREYQSMEMEISRRQQVKNMKLAFKVHISPRKWLISPWKRVKKEAKMDYIHAYSVRKLKHSGKLLSYWVEAQEDIGKASVLRQYFGTLHRVGECQQMAID